MCIKANNLQKIYKGRQVVRDVSLEVRAGEIVGLLGPNGAGKTTSFYMIVGLVTPDSGSILLDNQDITKMSLYERSRMGIGYLPQEPSIFRNLSVEDNIEAILETKISSKAERKNKLDELLHEFSITHIRKNLGKVLSGGERRRTEMARALAANPKFILLDEPFAGVDPIAVEEMQNLVLGLKEKGIGVLITDHNVSETLSITDRTYLMFEGSVLKAGSAEELAKDKKVRAVYLGENFVFHRKKRKLENIDEKNCVKELEFNEKYDLENEKIKNQLESEIIPENNGADDNISECQDKNENILLNETTIEKEESFFQVLTSDKEDK